MLPCHYSAAAFRGKTDAQVHLQELLWLAQGRRSWLGSTRYADNPVIQITQIYLSQLQKAVTIFTNSGRTVQSYCFKHRFLYAFKFLNSVEISGHDMKIFWGLSVLWSFQDLVGKADMITFHLEWDVTFTCPFWPVFRWPSVVKTWLQGESCAQVLYFLRRRCLLAAPCWGVLFPSVQRSNAIAFSLMSTHPTFPLTSDGVSWQMVTYFYCMFHWYWEICFPFPLCVSDAVRLCF